RPHAMMKLSMVAPLLSVQARKVQVVVVEKLIPRSESLCVRRHVGVFVGHSPVQVVLDENIVMHLWVRKILRHHKQTTLIEHDLEVSVVRVSVDDVRHSIDLNVDSRNQTPVDLYGLSNLLNHLCSFAG